MPNSAYPATASDWLQGARPHTWANAFAPVIAGTGAAAAAQQVPRGVTVTAYPIDSAKSLRFSIRVPIGG